MYKFKISVGLLAFSLLCLPILHSQTASFATWKDNKKAAYTIVHDDFGDYVTGIYDHAYPIATARGITFSFGAITGNCGATEWSKARTMIAAGHECINHSHSHKCGGSATNCSGTVRYGTADFATELDLSTQLIQTNTGVRPLFFIHPYDAYTQTILDYLKNNLGYIGSRAGTGSLNTSSFTNFMNLNFYGFDGSSTAISSLKPSVDDVITTGGYLMREFHGIADPSFGAMTVNTYTTHLDYVKTKIDAGLLWTATASEAITYKMQRDAYTIATVYNAATGTINVNFTNIQTLNTAILKTPVTVNLNLGTIAGTFTATQGTSNINTARNGSIVSFNIYPHQGNVVLQTGTITPNEPNNISGFSATAQSTAVALTWTNPTTNFDEVMIVAKANTAFTTQPDGTNYTANANFTGAGAAFEGGKVVYRGTGTNVTVTSLTNGTLYHVKAFSRLGTLWSSGVATSATPVATPPTGGFDATLCYRLTARHSGKALSLSSLSTSNNIATVQNTWAGGRDQVWRIKQVDATYHYFTSGFSGKAATIRSASIADGAALVQSDYLARTHQQFRFVRNTEGYYTLTARHSSKVLDVFGGYTADKTAIIQWNSNGDANQQWLIESVGCPTGTAALAVNRLVSFNGYLDNHRGILQWVINSGDFKDYYEVEKQTPTGDFQRLTVLNGNSSEAVRVFNFTDENLADGDNVYRLKSVDAQGKIETSEAVNIRYQRPELYVVSPNPTNDYLDVNLTACENQAVELTVLDASGLQMQHLSIEKAAKTQRLELDGLAAGQYVLQIQPTGKRRVTRLFVVVK